MFVLFSLPQHCFRAFHRAARVGRTAVAMMNAMSRISDLRDMPTSIKNSKCAIPNSSYDFMFE